MPEAWQSSFTLWWAFPTTHDLNPVCSGRHRMTCQNVADHYLASHRPKGRATLVQRWWVALA